MYAVINLLQFEINLLFEKRIINNWYSFKVIGF